tara:strand:- start:1002 stop:1376 length:375 start_codon:yes stop_codon:yes gene_type:complete
MGYSTTIKLVTGDNLPQLTFTLKDSNTAASGQTLDANDSSTWAPINLAGSVVKVRIRLIGATDLLATLIATISDATNGVCTVVFPNGTLTTAGTFEAEIEITNGSSQVLTVYDLVKLNIRSDFD